MESDASGELTTASRCAGVRARSRSRTRASTTPTGARRGGPIYTAYRDITHLATSPRAIWLGTRRSVYVIARRTFVDPHGPEHLVRALLEQIARQPGGSAQLARMAQIEETARGRVPLRATWGLFAICAALYAAQLVGGESVQAVGYFTGALVADGDWWRVVTAQSAPRERAAPDPESARAARGRVARRARARHASPPSA